MQRILATAAALLTLLAPAHAAKRLPPEVQASVDDLLKECKGKPAFKKGFLTRRDVNGDHVEDFVLDLGSFACGVETTTYCGSAGCVTEVFASLPGGRYAKVLDENVQRVDFRTVAGRPAMVLELHGSACDKVGLAPCGATLYRNGAKFSPAH